MERSILSLSATKRHASAGGPAVAISARSWREEVHGDGETVAASPASPAPPSKHALWTGRTTGIQGTAPSLRDHGGVLDERCLADHLVERPPFCVGAAF
ncbi:hypothetical protein GCM10010404_05850 [Nonomuraea africana]